MVSARRVIGVIVLTAAALAGCAEGASTRTRADGGKKDVAQPDLPGSEPEPEPSPEPPKDLPPDAPADTGPAGSPAGAACAMASDCASKLCVDGVCCTTGCTMPCFSCNQTGLAGTCRPVLSADDPECTTGSCGPTGKCGAKNGEACAAPTGCSSGFCRDGVCCATSCTAPCNACNQMGSAGTCTPLTSGSDPDGCAAPATCDATGKCKKPLGGTCLAATDCAMGSCKDGVCCDTPCTDVCKSCNQTGKLGTCSPVMTAADSDSCPGGTCDAAAACKKSPGAACTMPAECGTGFCRDGVCCDMPCDGACRACNIAKGKCTMVSTGTDPDACIGKCTAGGVCMPPPTINPSAKRITDERATLVGSGPNSCTNGPLPGDLWCAFYRPSSAIGKYELWAIDVTATAATGALANCKTGDGNCKKLSDDVDVDGNGVYAHGFYGRTLVFDSDATSTPGSHFVGTIRAWQPGWAAPQALTGPTGYLCVLTRSGRYGWCYDSVDQSSLTSVTFDYLAGEVKESGAPLVKQDNVVCCEEAGVRKYSAQFSPDDAYFLWSGRHATTETEAFYWKAVGDLGDASKKTVWLADGSSRAFFAGDGKKAFYLKDFNHSTAGAAAGDLKMTPFPPGATPTDIADKVGAGAALHDGTGADRGIHYLRNLAAGKGELWVLRDDASPASKVKAADGACQVSGVSKSLGRMLFARTCTATVGLSDLYTIAIDPTTGAPGAECTLTTSGTATTFGLASLSDDGRWAFWADDVDTGIGVGTPKLTDSSSCTTTALGTTAWAWDPVRSNGFVMNDDSDGVTATIRTVAVGPGMAGSPALVQAGAQVTYSVPAPSFKSLVYAMQTGDASDGLYVFTMPF